MHLGLALLLVVAGPEGDHWRGGATDARLIRTALYAIPLPFPLVLPLDWRGSTDPEGVVL